ncbi:hypothetical protein [Clostridium sp. HBUAS56010]|uniref:hypothetical protein n=1 Tax=Clostridium sp. HBUAS56010 TaxID=2571127 RepID=UPI001177F33E|nr:hypothetical protein [Clostridium sp. HBUAS56010]
MNNNGFIKRGEIIVTMKGDVCCTNTNCQHLNCVGCCTNVNAKCKYQNQRNDALLHYMFDDDKSVEFEIKI